MNTHNALEAVFGPIENSPWLVEAEKWKQELPRKHRAQRIALEVLACLDQTGLSQNEFAAMMGVNTQMVQKWLSGQVDFSPATLSKLESVLGVRIKEMPQSPR